MVTKKDASRLAGETLESLLFGFYFPLIIYVIYVSTFFSPLKSALVNTDFLDSILFN